jgi:hypothetical protein
VEMLADGGTEPWYRSASRLWVSQTQPSTSLTWTVMPSSVW